MVGVIKPDKDGNVGTGIKFERIRRITGYLVGTLDRFNNGKAAEERDRLKHASMATIRPLAWEGEKE